MEGTPYELEEFADYVKTIPVECRVNPSHIQHASKLVFRSMLTDPYIHCLMERSFVAFYGHRPSQVLRMSYAAGIDIHWSLIKLYEDPPPCIYAKAIILSPDAVACVPDKSREKVVACIQRSFDERVPFLIVISVSSRLNKRLNKHGFHFAKQFKSLISGFADIPLPNQNSKLALATLQADSDVI